MLLSEVVGGGWMLWWQQRRESEKEESSRGAGKKKGVHEIGTLNKPYGFGCSRNRSHTPLFGTGSCWTEAKHLTAS